VPNVANSVSITCDEALWMVAGQIVYVGNAGYYQVVAESGTGAQLTNMGSAGNAVPGTLISSGQTISPAGPTGTSGTGTVSSVALAVPSWLSQTGGPITSFGTITIGAAAAQAQNEFLATPNGSAGPVALRGIGTADLPAIPLATGVTGTLPIANGGTGQATANPAFNALAPTTAKGDLIVNTGSANAKLAVGTDGKVLTASSATTTGLAWTAATGTSIAAATAAGTNTYTAAPSPALTGYAAGQLALITFTNGNTGGASLNLNGLGAVTIQQYGAALTSGQIAALATLLLVYDGANFQIVGVPGFTYSAPTLQGYASGSISSAGSIIPTIPTGTIQYTYSLATAAGAGPYTYNVQLTSAGRTAGDKFYLSLSLPASTNPTVDVKNNAGGVIYTITGTGVATTFPISITFTFNGSDWIATG
jgi:hypothetical protein